MAEKNIKTLSSQAADKLLTYIQENGLSSGDKLPTETELVKLLEVGRNTVREAIRLLVSRNIIVVRQGSGSFISDKNGVSDDPFGFSMVSDRRKLTDDLLQLRSIIEPKVAAIAAQNATDDEIQNLQNTLEELEKSMKSRKQYSAADKKFHDAIALCTHNMVMINLEPVIDQGIEVFSSEVEEQEFEQTLISHRAIFEAIKNHDTIAAEREMQFHILYNQMRFKNKN